MSNPDEPRIWPEELDGIMADAKLLRDAGICNPIRHPGQTMRCSGCGKPWGPCDCSADVLRAFTCERCGFQVLTGGRSITELLARNRPRPS